AKPLYILNGPNHNLLGEREPAIYGRATLANIEKMCAARAQALGGAIIFRQTQREGELVEWLHEAREKACAVILNAGAYTHTSVALYDAIKAIAVPVIEVHLSNPHAREAFRHVSYISPGAKGVIAGFGAQSYVLAVEAALAAPAP
ncbi:MAG: type II 3-dehydroquinate dehydratase, partial [Hyphomonadaceae bacterium]